MKLKRKNLANREVYYFSENYLKIISLDTPKKKKRNKRFTNNYYNNATYFDKLGSKFPERYDICRKRISKVLWGDLIQKQFIKGDLKYIQKRISKVKSDLLIMYRESLKDESDYRVGVETYGYDSLESIKNNLVYISDRWNCSFRIKWLLDLLEIKTGDLK